ncbi:uncharacterized protein OCT59_008990 [Rhizophagus irregularis]|uniref:uncharacterized protein n=1 Tax=Rhizophagus irregularis TaxID=588596 RepID=UPI00332E6E7E|nr:hypothetical protein OCT59_008990 [Rhizophagus irregularis]
MGISSSVNTEFQRNQFRREYRFLGISVPAWIPNPKREYRFLGIRLQRGRRYSRKSAPTWMPIFQVQLSVLDFLGFEYILDEFRKL